MKFCFLIIASILLISCNENQTNSSTENSAKADPSASTVNFAGFDSMEVRRQRLLDTNYFFLGKLLDSSLNLANKLGFEKPFTASIDTGAFKFKNMSATLTFGRLFSPDQQHLIVKRYIYEYDGAEKSLYSDIYLLQNNTIEKSVSDTSDNGHVDDYFEDVNHDGYKDYVVQSYSKAGCCPRNLEMAFLYKHVDGRFEVVDLFNRESASANFFYETSYGLGNYIDLYKYKWVGLKKVLMEQISVTPTPEGVVPSSYTRITYPGHKEHRITELPDDFKRLKMAAYITRLESDIQPSRSRRITQ